MTRLKFIITFLALPCLLAAQETYEKNIIGRVYADSVSVEGIQVINLITEKATFTNASGMFSIMAKEDDLLVFNAVHLEYARKSIGRKEYENGVAEIKMYAKLNQLDEVIITNYSNINAKDLGIIDYTPKSYTTAERRLRTATNLNVTANVGMMAGGSISLDPLINWISGRTAMLKKELNIERKELLQQQLEFYFETEYYTESLHIPEIYVDGFKYYIVEDEDLATAISTKDRNKIMFRLSALAVDFLSFYNEYETEEEKKD